MIAPLLALGSSPAYRCADFLARPGARKVHVLHTVMIAAPASPTVEPLPAAFPRLLFRSRLPAPGARRRPPRSRCSGGAVVLVATGHGAQRAALLAAVVAVSSALYSAGAVLLVRGARGERTHRGRSIGVGTAAACLLALT